MIHEQLRSQIRVYDEAGNVIETHEHKGDFKSGEFLPSCAVPLKAI
jgi:hypothetical protein